MDESVSEERRNLVNTASRIHGRINNLEDAARMSERLLEKLLQTEDDPKPDKLMNEKESVKRPDLIDKFDSAANRIENLSEKICRNLDQALQMIG